MASPGSINLTILPHHLLLTIQVVDVNVGAMGTWVVVKTSTVIIGPLAVDLTSEVIVVEPLSPFGLSETTDVGFDMASERVEVVVAVYEAKNGEKQFQYGEPMTVHVAVM